MLGTEGGVVGGRRTAVTVFPVTRTLNGGTSVPVSIEPSAPDFSMVEYLSEEVVVVDVD